MVEPFEIEEDIITLLALAGVDTLEARPTLTSSIRHIQVFHSQAFHIFPPHMANMGDTMGVTTTLSHPHLLLILLPQSLLS